MASRLGLAGIPPISESIAVARDAVLAEYEGGLHPHLPRLGLGDGRGDPPRQAERGVRITAEVTPHHLALTDEAIESLDASRHKMNPPLREESDRRSVDRRP